MSFGIKYHVFPQHFYKSRHLSVITQINCLNFVLPAHAAAFSVFTEATYQQCKFDVKRV